MEEEEILARKHSYLRAKLKRYPFVKFKSHSLKNSILEAVFSRGDRKLFPVLLNAWENGARFDSWNDLFKFDVWENAFGSVGIDRRIYTSDLDKRSPLPWDHFQTGFKKTHLIQELERALEEKPTPSCLEKKCCDCMGCDLLHLYEKEFPEKWDASIEDLPPLGKKTGENHTYRAFYTKRGPARFFSHQDVSSMIQRGFRRAGVAADYSRGFHPKMVISFAPALPLGMESLDEVCEFRSGFLISNKEFLSRVNTALPEGIVFSKLEEAAPFGTQLTKDIESIIYSVKLDSPEMIEALESIRKELRAAAKNDESWLERFISEKFGLMPDTSMVNCKLDNKKKKWFIAIQFKPDHIIRPQDIVEHVFGIKNPVFIMAREKIIFRKTEDST
jgi:radical SAM-linked protein